MKKNAHLHFESIPHKMEVPVRFFQRMPFVRLELLNIGKNPFEHCTAEQQSLSQFFASSHQWS